MTKDIESINKSLFESIKHINEYGMEYWTARELMAVLEYKQWRRFSDAIERAKEACEASGNRVSDHFADAGKIAKTGVATKEIEDYHLSRYACYLIAVNDAPRGKAIALAQTYFAVKTRQQKLSEDFERLNEEPKRLAVH